jgi:hypothetical protein
MIVGVEMIRAIANNYMQNQLDAIASFQCGQKKPASPEKYDKLFADLREPLPKPCSSR